MEGFFESGGKRLFFRARGEGPPIVMVHGWSFHSRSWDAITDVLEGSHRVLAIDLRGHGLSDDDEGPYPFSTVVDDVIAMLDHLEIPRAVFAGHSMGAAVVYEAVVRWPDRVSGIVCMDGPSARNLGTSSLSSTSTQGMLSLAERLKPGAPLGHLSRVFERAYFSRRFRKDHPAKIKAWRAEFVKNRPPSLRAAYRSVSERTDITSGLGSVRVPALVVNGGRDVVVLPLEARDYARQIPGARLEILSGSGHLTPMEREDEIARLVLEHAGSCR